MHHAELVDVPARTAFQRAAARLDPTLEDRSLTDDVARAADALPELTDV
jgi:histidine ammonia-lyase